MSEPTPPAGQAPPSAGQPPADGQNQPPRGPEAGPGEPAGEGRTDDNGGPLAELKSALDAERRKAQAAERELSKLRQQSMSEQERAVAAAKDAGRAEGIAEAGKLVAAAEFKAAAAGKLADPGAALEYLDLSKFVGEGGDVDRGAIGKLVEKLAATSTGQATGRVPTGPREPAPDGDFLRAHMRANR